MHSSMMRTVHSSSRLLGGGVSEWGVSAQGGVCQGGCLPRGCLPRGWCIPACTEADTPMDRILDTHLWKYFLAATSLRTVTIMTIHTWRTACPISCYKVNGILPCHMLVHQCSHQVFVPQRDMDRRIPWLLPLSLVTIQ